MEAKIDIFLCKVFYSLIFNKLWRPVTLLYIFMKNVMDEVIFDLIPLFDRCFEHQLQCKCQASSE